MATTAAVWFEKLNKTIFVGLDGYPSHMVPVLENIVKTDAVEQITEHSDYVFLGSESSEDTRKAGTPTEFGVLYLEQGEPLTVSWDRFTQAPMFYNGEELASPDHKYTVAKDGSVIAHHRY